MEFQLKGWPAVIALILGVGAFFGYRAWLHNDPKVSAELRERLEFDLISEIAGAVTADAKATRAALKRGDRDEAARLVEGVVQRKVEVSDFDLRGTGDEVIVRANYIVHGPEGREPRTGYYRYSYSTLVGWQYQYETTVWSWRMKLF